MTALPWITAVREKLSDPDYAGWFVPCKSPSQSLLDRSSAGKASNIL